MTIPSNLSSLQLIQEYIMQTNLISTIWIGQSSLAQMTMLMTSILDSRLHRGNLQYLVKWLGYTEEYNTWEPLSNLKNAEEAVKDFH